MLKYRSIDTPFGELAVLWREEAAPRIVRILIPSLKRTVPESMLDYADAAAGHQSQVDALCAEIARFLTGEPVLLPIHLLDPSVCTPFQWRVLMVDKSIPRGQVRTYRQVAVAVGNPRGARAVGNALARNPFPIVIPCHRAVRSDGSLGGYYGGLQMKRALLEMEGVAFDARGRVILQEHGAHREATERHRGKQQSERA